MITFPVDIVINFEIKASYLTKLFSNLIEKVRTKFQ